MAKAGGGVIVTGDKVLDRVLKGMPAVIQKKFSRQATRKGAKDIVLPAAKDRVGFDTGDLEESLVVRAIPRSRSRVGHQVQTRDGFYQGDEHYGAQLEFGTKERKHKSGKKVGSIKPHTHAFLRPAVYDNEEKLRELYISDVKEMIVEAARKRGRTKP